MRKEFERSISVLRILDSRKEKFVLSKEYEHKVKVVDIVTAPEIEILIILNENKLKEFKKTRKKPSEFCKDNLKLRNVKAYDFVKGYFSDVAKLISAIKVYTEISDIPKGEYSLLSLIDNTRVKL